VDLLMRAATIALWCGVLVPILYFGAQLAAVQFYPGYNFLTQSASELGSDRSTAPMVLNTGAILTGVCTLIAALGFPSALRRTNCPRFLAVATALAMLSMGAGAIWAGVFSLPDPRHNPRMLGAGAFLLPLLFAAAVVKRPKATQLKVYLFANVALFVLLIPVMSGATAIDLARYRGLLQRIAAAVLYVPVGVVAASLLRSERIEGLRE
jgi:hypothetical membrane protein